MKSFYILLIMVMEITAYDFDVKSDPRSADIHLMENQPWDGEKYLFGYLTTHGVMVVERGFLKTTPDGNQILVKVGAFTRFLNDNEGYIVKYYADENGYSEKVVDKLKDQEIYSLRTFVDEPSTTIGTTPLPPFTYPTYQPTRPPGTSPPPSPPPPPPSPPYLPTSSDPRNHLVDMMLDKMIDIISENEKDIENRFKGL